jgi:hypothetical protein
MEEQMKKADLDILLNHESIKFISKIETAIGDFLIMLTTQDNIDDLRKEGVDDREILNFLKEYKIPFCCDNDGEVVFKKTYLKTDNIVYGQPFINAKLVYKSLVLISDH